MQEVNSARKVETEFRPLNNVPKTQRTEKNESIHCFVENVNNCYYLQTYQFNALQKKAAINNFPPTLFGFNSV